VAKKLGLRSIALIAPPLPEQMPGRPALTPAGSGAQIGPDALATGLLLTSFEWNEYRGKVTKKTLEPVEYILVAPDTALKTTRAVVARAITICNAQNFARTVAFRPGNEIHPVSLAQLVQRFAKDVGLSCRVLDEKQMKRLGMGGILAVGGGSNR